MAEKISTLILKIDLACHKCYNKIRKILCNLQDQERITTISYDNRNNIVVIAGTFDPQRLCCRIRCKGGKIIKDIHIVDGAGGKPEKMAESPPPPPVNTGKKKSKKDKRKEMPPPAEAPPPPAPHEPPPETMRPPSQPPAQAAPPDREISAMVPAIVEEEKPRERPAELEPPPPQERPPMEMPPPVACIPVMEKPSPRGPQPPPVKPFYPVDMTTTTMVEIPSWPAPPPPAGPSGGSCCAPCYQGCYEGCRCGSCGRVYGYSVPSARPPSLLPPPCYGGGATMSTPYCSGYSGCRLVNEEDPTACTIV